MALSLLLAGFSVFAIGAVDCLNFTVDDTFIPLRFAENWARGLGLVFNAGQRVEGYSDFLWTILLGLFARAGVTQARGLLDLLVAAKLLGALFAFAALAIVAWHAWRTSAPGAGGDPDAWPMLAVLGAGSSYSYAVWALSGMETALCVFLVSLSACLTLMALRRYDESGAAPRGLLLAGRLKLRVAVARTA